MLRILALICLLPVPALAERVMTAAEFEAFTTGKTMDYSDGAAVWGREEYLPNRRVRFSFTDDECREGSWYEAGPMICFVYADVPGPKCWTYFTDGTTVTTLFAEDPPGTAPSTVVASNAPLICQGPDVGV